MTTPLLCLLFFAGWTLLIVFGLVAPYRVINVLRGKARPNTFTPGVPHGPDWYQRVMRAHVNCAENLPIFGAVVVVGHLVGLRDGTFATLAMIYCGARVGQTLAHVVSGRSLAVNVRFTFFLVQIVVIVTMVVIELRAQ